MIKSVLKYGIHHSISKEQGAAHLATQVYADGVMLPDLKIALVTVNTIGFETHFESAEGVYPKSEGLELNLMFLSGLHVIGIYPEILVSFDGKKVNYVQSFTYSIDMTKDNRYPLIHLAVL